MNKAPTYRGNLYSPEAISNPYPVYAELRALGPVVWLQRHRAYAITGYEQCRATLLNDSAFISGKGVALNAIANRLSRGTTLNSDGEDHTDRRKLVAHRLTPRALRSMKEAIETTAEQVATQAVARGQVDGVALARSLPLQVVPDLVGWPEDERENLLKWASATFDILGPINGTSMRSATASLGMLRFARRIARTENVLAGSMGAEVVAAANAGLIPKDEASALMIDYLAPSLDTTISAISSALLLFALHPDQWAEVRADRTLIPNAVNEVIRLESPLRAFSRLTATDTNIAGISIRKGRRVVVLYASGNRDEKAWDSPDVFDIHRDATRHIGFGHGTHGCAGQGLARLESHALLNALANRVQRIELAGKPTWGRNNIIRSLATLPVTLRPIEET
ncbi:cytochrome P450 [Nocardioides sp. YIM B13467]|uniref:cytochrome P450 n=1 Tax=Nocardioides sp. YIM B13467 TaxID=3366294 RepID=UPI00366F3BC9